MLITFLNWLEDRTGVCTLVKKIAERPIPVALMNLKMWPAVMFFLMVVQLITGFILWLNYSPSTQTSYESVYFIQYSLWGGWLLRGIHHFSAQVLVAAAIFYVLHLIFMNLYRAPREVVFWLALLMFFWGLGACLTGDLLSWDQNSYGATQVRVKYLTQIPVVGTAIYELAVGGTAVNSHTLTRFTALHIGVFGGGLLVLMLIHAVCDARAETGLLRAVRNSSAKSEKSSKKSCYGRGVTRWWTDQALVNSVACCVMMFLVLFLVSGGNLLNIFRAFPCEKTTSLEHPSAGLTLGVPLGPPADTDPATSFGTARPEWTFRGLYQYTLNFAGKASEFILIFIIPAGVLGVIFLMPFIGKMKFGHIFNTLYTAVLVVVMVMLTNTSYKNDKSDKKYLAAQKAERGDAQRLYQIVTERGGLAPEGALAMLKSDWVTQGPRLFEKHCVACHHFTPGKVDGMGKVGMPVLGVPTRKILPEPQELTPEELASGEKAPEAPKASAPNLYQFPSREWIAGFFKTKTITSSEYYGNTTLKSGSMVGYVKSNLPEYLDDEYLGQDGLDMIIDTLYEESRLAGPRPMIDAPEGSDSEKLPQGISEPTMFMFEDFGCTGCHPFYDRKGGAAPDLTAYGSQGWTWRVIADPMKFYAKNDRMLSYHPEKEGSDKNLMTQKEMDMLVKWLFDGETPRELPPVAPVSKVEKKEEKKEPEKSEKEEPVVTEKPVPLSEENSENELNTENAMTFPQMENSVNEANEVTEENSAEETEEKSPEK